MRKAIIAIGLAAGMAVAQAAVFLTLSGPGAGVLPPLTGPTTGAGAVAWDGAGTAGAAIATDLDLAAGGHAYVVRESDGVVVAVLTPGTILAYSDLLGVPSPIAILVPYFLIADLAVVPVGGVAPAAPYLKTENFMLVPEPGTYALLAGLGLLGFAGYRRFRG